jgi:hypothetical protein
MVSYTQSNRSVVWSIVNDELILMILSPTGGLLALESRFTVTLNPQISFTSAPVVTEVNYFDVDGNPVAGIVPADYTVSLN